MYVRLAKSPDLVDRLAAFDPLAQVPRAEVEWLAAAGELRRYSQGELMMPRGAETREMIVIVSGRIVVTFEQGTGHRHAVESAAGSVTGLLPYSRLTRALGDVAAEESSDILAIDRDRFPELIRECPGITTKLVQTMVDRARVFTGINWQDEKLLSLGRLAAGLAHELNNPASAAARSAKLLNPALREIGDAAFALGATRPTPEQRAVIAELLGEPLRPATAGVPSPLERSEREEVLASWLEAHAIDSGLAAPLADHGLTTAGLDRLAAALPGSLLGLGLRWIAAASTSYDLAADVERSAGRIHELVSAVKRFSYVDRAGTPEPIDIGSGLRDTVAVLAAKAREKSIRVTLDVPPGLPSVSANTAALNQVWSNLLENALDAATRGGDVLVDVARRDGTIRVSVIDDGPGIPADVQERMFEPFFTTKDVGAGSGLGLDIVRRVVRALEGRIEVETRPGRTEFRVSLPVGSDSR